MKTLRVAIVQFSAGRKALLNLDRLMDMTAGIESADLIAMPEVFAVRGTDEDYRNAAEPLDGPVIERMAKLAASKRAWVLAGSLIEKAGKHVYNTSVLLDRAGAIAASYRKIHLFEAHLEDGRTIREADAYKAGSKPVFAEMEGWGTGFSICYDLRFPELYRHYSGQGAHLLLIPSNFTQRTGKDHWETLVRARAIENQCFVIAPDQCGVNQATGVASYGHSMAVGPWGETLCKAGDDETVLTVDLDPALLREARSRVPALEHRML